MPRRERATIGLGLVLAVGCPGVAFAGAEPGEAVNPDSEPTCVSGARPI